MKTLFVALLICLVVITIADGYYGGGYRRRSRRRNMWSKWSMKYCSYKKKFVEVRNSPQLLNGLQIIGKIVYRYWTLCRCSQACLKNSHCGVFLVQRKTCFLMSTQPFGKKPCIYTKGDRLFAYIGIHLSVLVYRVQSNVDGDAIVRYNDNSYVSSDAETILAADLTVALNKTYKSALLDHWNTFNVVGVNLGFLRPDNTLGWVVFDARLSNSKYNWMVQNKLLSSPWYDLTTTSPTNNFGVFGFARRRFYIMKHDGCPKDILWLAVVPSGDPCPWGAGYKNPEIIYSPQATGYPVNNRNPGKASTLVMVMKLKMG